MCPAKLELYIIYIYSLLTMSQRKNIIRRIISNISINYFLLFQTYMSMLKFFFGVENMCHIQMRKKNLGNLCQKSISKCNAIYSWKKRLLWCKFNIFQYVQFPTYYIKHNWLSRVDVKLVIFSSMDWVV